MSMWSLECFDVVVLWAVLYIWGNCYPLELSCIAIPAPGQFWQSLGWVFPVEPVPWTLLPTPVTCGRDTHHRMHDSSDVGTPILYSETDEGVWGIVRL